MFIVWYQIWRLIRGLYILHPGHWSCSFVWYFNSMGSIQSCGLFSALVLSYTHCQLCPVMVLIYTWVQWSMCEGSVQILFQYWEGRDMIYFFENPAPSGVRDRTAGIATLAKLHVLTIAPCPSPFYSASWRPGRPIMPFTPPPQPPAENLLILSNISTLKYLCMNHKDARVFFNLKLSKISQLALSVSFEYQCYGSIAIIIIWRLVKTVPALKGLKRRPNR